MPFACVRTWAAVIECMRRYRVVDCVVSWPLVLGLTIILASPCWTAWAKGMTRMMPGLL